jgi:hypothetical protein
MPVKITIELSDQSAAAAERLLATGLWGFTLAEVIVMIFDTFIFTTFIRQQKTEPKRKR